MINIKELDSSLLKIDKTCKNIGIYNIGFITIKKTDEFKNNNSANPLYQSIGKTDGFIEKAMKINI